MARGAAVTMPASMLPSLITRSLGTPMSLSRAGLLLAETVFVALALGAGNGWAADLPRDTPESQGVPSSAVLAFLDAAEKIEQMNSLMLVRHGRVIAEGWWRPYAAEDPHVLYSLSKSFTSTAVGMAIAEGKFSLDNPVLQFFQEEAPAKPDELLKQMRVRDLLNMNTGHVAADVPEIDFATKESVVREFLHRPVTVKPGTHFVYNTPASYMAGAIVQKTTGQKLNDYLQTRLYEPLGIEAPRWGETAEGMNQAGFGLNLRTADVAKFGQLYLQKGRWGEGEDAKQLLPAAWIELATSRQCSNGSNPESDWEQGYGYQFWRCRHGLYRGDGAFGQFCIVMPEQDAVVAITSGTSDMQGVMNAVWTHLLPAMASDEPLPTDEAAATRLAERLAALEVAPQKGEATSPLADEVSGKSFRFPENERTIESLRFDFEGEDAMITLRARGKEYKFPASHGQWKRGGVAPRLPVEMRRADDVDAKCAATGGWQGTNAYAVKIVQYETPFITKLVARFAGDEVVLELQDHVQFGQVKAPMLVGRAE
jgi:CubicO group peptidase (beta-lactamase class C family)